ncbi:CdaR family protein [Ignavibacterium sp.]|uniref:CdaR family protein n=1 Tax=Ignavibacterium sp. TaxID=2651167 RepID=UPI00307F7704
MNKKIYIIIISVLFSVTVWVSIALSDEYYSTYKLPIEVIDLPSGYAVGNKLPDTITIRLKADGWKLMSFELGGSNYFFVSVKGDSGIVSTNLLTNVENNPWFSAGINILDINPKTIKIHVEPFAEKMLRVIPQLDLDFKEGFNLATKVKIEPDSILVSGPKSLIKNLEGFRTKEISLRKLDQKLTITSELENLRGFETFPKIVNITLDVQRIVENTISNIPVNVLNQPANVEIVLIPNTIVCTFRGGINILGKISANDITASVDYFKVINDTLGFIKPEIQLPADLSLLSVKPDKLKYVIKKY